MNSKLLLPIIIGLGLASPCTFANNDETESNIAIGISSFAIAQSSDDGYSEQITYSGWQIFGSYNHNNYAQTQVGFYRTTEDFYEDQSINGFSVKLNLGKGFQKKGFKIFGTIGAFKDKITNNSYYSFNSSASGFEFGGGAGLNFEVFTFDYGVTIRTLSSYQLDDEYISTATAYLSASANF